MVKNRILLAVIYLLGPFLSMAQDRFVVHFTDKNNSIYSVDAPEKFLSLKSIDRRQKQGIFIIEQDFPVNQNYINEVRNLGAEVFFTSKWFNALLIQATDQEVQMILNLSFVSKVEYVAPGTKLKVNARTSKIDESAEFEAELTDFQNDLLGVSLLHSEGYKGQGMLIAIMDGGFKGVDTAPAFSSILNGNRLIYKKNLVENDDLIFQYIDHGTKVMSTIGAYLANEYLGIAPESQFTLFVTEDDLSEYRIEEYNFLFAAEIADSVGVDIITASLGYSSFDDGSMDYSYADLDGKTTVITRAAELAFTKGILMINSAGNSGTSSTNPYISAPADGANVLSVGAISNDRIKSDFSSIGPSSDGRIKPDLMALGTSTTLVNQNGIIVTGNGTSYAAPQIAGFAAIVWQSQPDLTNKELFNLLLTLGDKSNSPDNNYGYGIPNYAKLITGIDGQNNDISVFPNPFNDKLTFKILVDNDPLNIQIIDIAGRIVLSNYLSKKSQTIDTSQILPGIYFIKIQNSKKENLSFRIVKY